MHVAVLHNQSILGVEVLKHPASARPRRSALARPLPVLGVQVPQRQEQPQWGPWTRGFVKSSGSMNAGLLIKAAYTLNAHFMQVSQSVAEPTSEILARSPDTSDSPRKSKPFLVIMG